MAGCNSLERFAMKNDLIELTDIEVQLIRDDESTLDTLLNCGEIADAFPEECSKMLEILKPITDWLIEEGV